MTEHQIIAGIVVDKSNRITFFEVCERYNIPEQDLIDLIEYGIIDADIDDCKSALFGFDALERIFSALRLKKDLGINTPGIALALELLDKIEHIEREIAILKRQTRIEDIE
tara:strand:- start:2219 stop:2551 length:333 start_codon:yes stop_codon:yes gene_type:complete